MEEEKKVKTTEEVELKIGKFVLKKPNAGGRNKALIKAELPTEESKSGTYVKWSLFWTELLPHAIQVHPFTPGVRIRDALESLSSVDYDKLLTKLKDLYKNETEMKEALQGESSELSKVNSSQKEDGSETSSSSTTSAPSSTSARDK